MLVMAYAYNTYLCSCRFNLPPCSLSPVQALHFWNLGILILALLNFSVIWGEDDFDMAWVTLIRVGVRSIQFILSLLKGAEIHMDAKHPKFEDLVIKNIVIQQAPKTHHWTHHAHGCRPASLSCFALFFLACMSSTTWESPEEKYLFVVFQVAQVRVDFCEFETSQSSSHLVHVLEVSAEVLTTGMRHLFGVDGKSGGSIMNHFVVEMCVGSFFPQLMLGCLFFFFSYGLFISSGGTPIPDSPMWKCCQIDVCMVALRETGSQKFIWSGKNDRHNIYFRVPMYDRKHN
jgi:hypothetical protein